MYLPELGFTKISGRRSMLRMLASCMIYFAFSAAIYAQEDIRLEIEKHLEAFYLDAAEDRIPKIPQQAYQGFYSAHVLMYKYFGSLDPSWLVPLRNNWKTYTKGLEELGELDSLKLTMLAELSCKRAMIEFLEGNYLTAIGYMRSGRRYTKRSRRKFPDRFESLKLEGMFNLAFGAVPSKYQWITNALGFYGDIELGIQQIQQSAKKGSMLNMEGFFLYCYAQSNMRSRPEASIKHLKSLRKEMSEGNILLDFMLATTYFSVKENEKALSILRAREKYYNNPHIFFIGFWDYRLGKSSYVKEDYAQAEFHLSRFLQSYKGKLFRGDARFRMGMSQILTGNLSAGRQQFQILLNGGEGDSDEDEYAMAMAKYFLSHSPHPYQLLLFRARNLYDGGYYDQSSEILTRLETQELDLSQETELHYRFARIYHTIGDLQAAEKRYKKCINLPDSDQRWLQAYSHYFLAEMARGKGNLILAKTEYKKALAFDNYYYQAGLENRCKVALSEL